MGSVVIICKYSCMHGLGCVREFVCILYVYISVYIYINVCWYLFKYACMLVYVYTCIHMYVGVCTCGMLVWVHVWVYSVCVCVGFPFLSICFVACYGVLDSLGRSKLGNRRFRLVPMMDPIHRQFEDQEKIRIRNRVFSCDCLFSHLFSIYCYQ